MKQATQTTTCPACSLLCDDIVVASDGSIDAHGCDKGTSYFQISSSTKPKHYTHGKPANLDSAISAAVDILGQSKAPLICGLEHLSTQAQQVAWKIADRIGGTIDTTLTNQGRSSLFSLQKIGKVTASLGEISQRSDLILFWFCDPIKTHPRLLERLMSSRKRKIIVIGEPGNLTASHADQFLEISKDRAADVLSILRAEVLTVNNIREIDVQWIELAERLRSASYGSVFYGQTESDSAFDLANESMAALIRTLNHSTRFVGMKLRSDANAISAENVLAWSSGYAMAVNHAAGFPRSNWLEYSAETILARRECDAVLFATGVDLKNAFDGLGRAAQQHLSSTPRIALSPIENFSIDNDPVQVSIAIGIVGLTDCGELCRNDDVSMPVSALVGASPISPPKDSVAVTTLQGIYKSLSG